MILLVLFQVLGRIFSYSPPEVRYLHEGHGLFSFLKSLQQDSQSDTYIQGFITKKEEKKMQKTRDAKETRCKRKKIQMKKGGMISFFFPESQDEAEDRIMRLPYVMAV